MRRVSLVIYLILLVSCSDETVQPLRYEDHFASCGNSDPISYSDSINVGRPNPRIRISQLRISPYNGWWAGEYEGYRWGDGQYGHGIYIYDPISDTPIARYDEAGYHYWSPDGRKLLLSTYSALYVIDIPSLEVRNITPVGIGVLGTWTLDGSCIYARYGSKSEPAGIYSMKSNGSNKKFITNQVWNATKLLDKNRLFAPYPDSIRTFNINTGVLSLSYRPQVRMESHPELYDISPDRQSILYETWHQGDIYEPWGNGIWVMDTATWSPRKVLGAQWWRHEYYPTWASESTFYASVYCRNDSSSMVWEFDLNGNPIRQVTTKDMHVWME